jgi:hypothetical protein
MPLARLENFLKNLDGNTLYVDPNELDSTDSIENRGNSRLRPFKTIQRALLEAANFSYVAGSNNDKFDQTTILISPGTHYIDNRPGYYVDSSDVVKDVNNSSKNITQFNILSNFDITDPSNELYIYNSASGGVILPRGTSLVATDLRKTKIRPLFVPDPENDNIERTSIFNLTGSCYFFGFTIFDGDPLGKVYNTYGTSKVTPSYSHHKLTAFEYADGVNYFTPINSGYDTNRTDLEMYYYKVALAYGQQSGRSIIDGYDNLQPSVDEYRIVGELGVGSVGISSVRSGPPGGPATNVITVDTEVEHGLSTLTPILISGVGLAEEDAGANLEYNGNFVVSQILSPTRFTYLTVETPTSVTLPTVGEASVKVVSDTTASSSPYVFNCSLKSVYGMNGLHADGSKATGFRSMVTAQFTGISLQRDDRAFVKYNSSTGEYEYQSDLQDGTIFLHQESDSVYRPEWSSFHIKASNDSFIQCVSIFAIGYTNQFVADSGGDQSITNSNSNFGQNALFSKGFKANAFPKDDHGFITHIISPKDVSTDEQQINGYTISSSTSTKVYLDGYTDSLNPPRNKIRGYAIGGRIDDKIYYGIGDDEYSATISPNGILESNITAIDLDTNELTLASISGISTGLSVKIVSKNSILPDGVVHDQTYFVKPFTGNNIRIYENLFNCYADSDGSIAIDIQNDVGLTANNLYVVSRVSDRPPGDPGSPIQWDSAENQWYISITSPTTGFADNSDNAVSYLKRVPDNRPNDDKAYRFRYVIPKDASNASVPSTGFIIQKSGSLLNSSYTSAKNRSLVSPSLAAVRNKNAIIDAYYSANVATIITKNPHNLKVGNKVSIQNLKSSNEPTPLGIGTGTGFNGRFEVASVVDDLTFTYSTSVDPGTITAGVSSTANWLSIPRDCAQSSNFEVPPYTIYSTSSLGDRGDLPFFTCDEVESNYSISKVQQIQRYVQGSSDGVYHITLDCFKNTPNAAPFSSTTDYKFSQDSYSAYPKKDFDNLNVDPNPSVTAALRSTIGLVNINDPYLSSSKEVSVQFLKDFGLGKTITGFVKSGDDITITTSENHGLGGIKEVELFSSGSGYDDGTYFDIPLCGGSGEGATVNVIVSGGIVSSVEIASSGSGYFVGDSLTIRGIPGSTSTTTVQINSPSLLNFDSSDTYTIQILGATNSGNNGAFIISSITKDTITFENASGVTEATTNATCVISGTQYTIDSAPYDSTTGITTVTVSSSTPHSLSFGNKVIFDAGGLGICTVTSVTGNTIFTIEGDASSAAKVFLVGLSPAQRDTNSLNENLNTRSFVSFTGFKFLLQTQCSNSTGTIYPSDPDRLKKGDFIQIENEIMLITSISGADVYVTRGLFGTTPAEHPANSLIKVIQITPVELRRPSILRASGHTFEYVGFGPGNYSTAMPSNQTKVLTGDETLISQAISNKGGSILYSGMNSNGEFFIGRRRWDAATGQEIQESGDRIQTISGGNGEEENSFDILTVNTLNVNTEINAENAVQRVKQLTVAETAKAQTFVGNGVVPVGSITLWIGRNASALSVLANWKVCDGSQLKITDYPELYYNLTYGPGGPYTQFPHGANTDGNGNPGSTHFRIPDLRGKFVVGAGPNAQFPNGTQTASGAQGGSTDAIIPYHTHSFTWNQFNESSSSGGGQVMDGIDFAPTGLSNSETVTYAGTSGNEVNANLPPYYGLVYIIRIK